ncbi:MAG: TIGR03663 family protein [Luteolibacter sp.]|nr:TIGR03663 family protein [Luteolibacter sp.]
MTKRILITACWIGVLAAGAFLRFDSLADRPFHADEATGARITASRMESGSVTFDPKHYHGPLLADLAIPLCKSRGEDGWREMSKSTLRALPAIAGTLVLLLPLLWRKRFGDGPMLLAAAFMATSPLLVYYSRMFIHESLLVFFGMALWFMPRTAARRGLPGFLLGLMFATKETFAISVLAWSGAAVLLAWENRRSLDFTAIIRTWWIPAALSLLAFILSAGFLYTDGLQHPRGALDAVRTFFVYETVEGHDKPFTYYLQLLALPQKSAGHWWFGTPLVLLALWAVAATFRKDPEAAASRPFIHLLGWSAAGHLLIYSLFAYKTPWLACLPWAHVCVLAGFSLTGLSRQTMASRIVLVALAGASVITQFQQARVATGRLASDERNLFAYVPTRPDIEKLEAWLGALRTVAPSGTLERVAVIGREYWPLPWYLRSFEKTGYWYDPPPDLGKMPLVFAMPESVEEVMAALGGSHMPLPRGLRAGVPVYVFVRSDLWELWMKTEER